MRETIRWMLWNGTSLERQQQFARKPVTSVDSSESACQQTTEETWAVQKIQWRHSSRPGKSYFAEVPFYRQKDTGWYIPHYGLVSPNKPDKIRRFCNAKAPQKGISLNDNLLAGPDLLGKMHGILLQFRQGAIAIQGDIEAMFMQIGVQQQDRRYLRFMWKQSQPRIKGVQIPTTHLWSQGLTSLRKFCFATDSQRRHQKSPKISWDHSAEFYMDEMVASVSDTITTLLQPRMSRILWKNVNLTWQNGVATAVSVVSRCKTIFANQSKSSSVKVFIKEYLEFIGAWTTSNYCSEPNTEKTWTGKHGHNASFCVLCQVSTILWESYLHSSSEQKFDCKNCEKWTWMGQSHQSR